jgi:peptide chain release factor 3
MEPAPWQVLRWINPETPEETIKDVRVPSGCSLAWDIHKHYVILLPSEWTLNYFKEKNPDVEVSDIPYDL